jgi:hypothetical protein
MTPSTNTLKHAVPQEDPAILLANGMLEIIKSLTAVMSEEMELIETRRHAEHAILLRNKQQLTVKYRAGMKTLASQPDIFKNLPETLRNVLKVAAQKLKEMSDRNARCLRAAVIATQSLVRTFVDLVREEVAVKSGYSNVRAGMMQPGNYDIVYKPIAVDRTA